MIITKYELTIKLISFIEFLIVGTLCILSSLQLNCVSLNILFSIGVFYIFIFFFNSLRFFISTFYYKVKQEKPLISNIFASIGILILASIGMYFSSECSSWSTLNLVMYIYIFISFGLTFSISLFELNKIK